MSISSPVNVKAFIDARPMGRMQWLLLALCFLVVAADGMDVAIMGFVAPSVIADWAVQEGLARREDFYSYLDDKLYKLELDPNGHRFSVWDADHSGWTGEL